jgi:hypothetical protein
MRSRLSRAALTASLAAAILIPLSPAQASSPDRIYMETIPTRACDKTRTFWRTTASGQLIHRRSDKLSSLVFSATGRKLAYSSGVGYSGGAQMTVVDIDRRGV